MPDTPTKTHLMLFEKRSQPISDLSKSNHKTFTAEAEVVGSDSNNDPVFLRTQEGDKILGSDGKPLLDDDLPAIVKAFGEWYQ